MSTRPIRATTPVELPARIGYAARGLVYTLVGWLAILASLGKAARTPDSKTALATILAQPFGLVLLALVAAGLVCFALWRGVQAAFDVDQLGTTPKALLRRTALAVSAVVNAGLAMSAVQMILRTSAADSGDGATRDWTAYILSLPFGQILVGSVGIAIIGAGGANAWKGYQGRVMERVSADGDVEPWLARLGQAGYLARGFVLVVIGGFFVSAACRASASEVQGLSGALQVLQDQPYGKVVLLLTAVGLFAFGAFQIALARHRRIKQPRPGLL